MPSIPPLATTADWYCPPGEGSRRGFLTASYTQSHSLDDWQNYAVAYPTNQFYASSPYDVRDRLSLGASYELRGAQHGNGFERRIFGGRTVAGSRSFRRGLLSGFTGVAFAGQLINPALPATASNISFASGSATSMQMEIIRLPKCHLLQTKPQ